MRCQLHYQIDVLMIPASQIPFTLLLTSYSSTTLLLAMALRVISPSLTMHSTHLVLRHSPFAGLPAVDVTLAHDPQTFCAWSGLDLDRWNAGWMASEEDSWRWLTEVSEESILGRAWKRLAQLRDRGTQHSNGSKAVRDRFVEWLRSEESKWFDPAVEPIPSTPNPELSTDATLNIVDPESPAPLDRRAMQALVYWGKTEEYEKGVEQRRVVAARVGARQRRRGKRGGNERAT